MNHIYRTIYNTTTQTGQVASELAKTQGQSTRPNSLASITLAIALSLFSSHVFADGGKGGHGSAGGAGGIDNLTTAGANGANGSRFAYGGGGGAGITGGRGGRGGSGNWGVPSGGCGGAHGFMGATLPASAVVGGKGCKGGNGLMGGGLWCGDYHCGERWSRIKQHDRR